VKRQKMWFLALSVATMLTANSLVMAATTQDSKDSASDKRPAAAGERETGKKGGMRGFHGDNKALLEFLKVDAQTFGAKLKEGKTLVAIAQEQGISEQALKDFMVAQMSKRMEARAKDGKDTDNKVAPTKADIEKRVTDMINGKGPMQGHGPRGHAPFDNTKLLGLLKLDEQSFRAQMKEGKSLAAIAKQQGVSEKKLKDFMVQEMSQRIDEGVKAGRIQQDKATQMKANMEKRVSDMINGKGPMQGHGPKGHARFDNTKLLGLLKLDEQSFRAQMKEGKSLAAIAKQQGVSEQELKNFMMQEMSQRIDEGVKAGRIQQDKATQMKANMEKRVSDMINGKGPMHKHEQKPQE